MSCKVRVAYALSSDADRRSGRVPVFQTSMRALNACAVVLTCWLISTGWAVAQDYADLVDPRIGNPGSRGQTLIGPTRPHGSVHPSPDAVGGGTAGYKLGLPVRGFSQLHASGTGWGSYGYLLLSPQVGLQVGHEDHDSPTARDQATPYSYSAELTRYGIVAQVAPTRHAAMYRFDYPAGDQSHLVLDLAHRLPGELLSNQVGEVLESQLDLGADGRSASGWSRYSGGWGAGPHKTVYFHLELDSAPADRGVFHNATVTSDLSGRTAAAGDRLGGWWRFEDQGSRTVLLKIAVSFHSVERAQAHLREELPAWSYEAVVAEGRADWNDRLGRIAVEGGDTAARRQFYTALYHAQIMPRDRTGEFARFPSHVPMWDDHYAIWDTWRTKYPLMLLIDPAMVRGTIASFIERQRVDGHVRDSFTAGNGGKSGIADQGGNDLDNVIADAMVKGLTGVDWQAAYGVVRHNAEFERRGNFAGSASNYRPLLDTDDYRRNGWLPAGIMSVSNTLEYAYNDFNVSQMARALGHEADAERYLARSRGWQTLFNPEVTDSGYQGFILPRDTAGAWPEVDLVRYPGSWGPYFYEAASWGYSFFVPHQTARLIELMGGPETFVRRLEHGLETSKVDFSNEPAFLTPALFHYAGRPDLSAKWVRAFARQKVDAVGYPGDDDSGAMSSYYVWAAMGLFPNAGQDLYLLNGPLFDRVTVRRPEDGVLTITRSGDGDYVAAVTLNDVPLDRSWLRHRELTGASTLHFQMSPTPTNWGRQTLPPSDAAESGPIPPPVGEAQ